MIRAWLSAEYYPVLEWPLTSSNLSSVRPFRPTRRTDQIGVKGQNGSNASINWLISDLIPKKSEKFEFRKNFVTIFSRVKNWPSRNFEKNFFFLKINVKNKITFLGQFLTLENMVTNFFRNSNFSDFLGIKSEISHYEIPYFMMCTLCQRPMRPQESPIWIWGELRKKN